MTNTARNRFALDLDEIERQLASQPAPAPVAKSDPLSELARIVGQDDPFRTILKPTPPSGARGHDAAFDDLFVQREPVAPARYPGSLSAAPSFEEELSASLRAPARVEHAAGRGHGQPGDLDWQAGQQAYQTAADWEPDYASQDLPQSRVGRSRKGLLTVAAVLGVAALGVGTALLMGSGTSGVSGDVPLIKAQTGPLKVQPENPGGVEIPNQNKQIYERAAADQKTKVVNREEQPLDVTQATRPQRASLPQPVERPGAPALVPAAPAAPIAQAAAPQGAGTIPALGEPRRVRTVSVRPDGSVIGSDAPPPAPPVRPASITAAQTPPPAPAPTRVAGVGSAPIPTTTASTPAPRVPAPTPAAPPPVATPAAPRSAETPRPAAQAPVQKEQQRVAALPPTTAAPTPAPVAEPAPATRASSGGWVVQLGVSGTEAGARTAFNNFRTRYGAALGTAGPVITQAEVNGSTIFRVRAGPMERDDAEQACTKVKAAGGACFVARN